MSFLVGWLVAGEGLQSLEPVVPGRRLVGESGSCELGGGRGMSSRSVHPRSPLIKVKFFHKGPGQCC